MVGTCTSGFIVSTGILNILEVLAVACLPFSTPEPRHALARQEDGPRSTKSNRIAYISV
jgi:hypothetical protein